MGIGLAQLTNEHLRAMEPSNGAKHAACSRSLVCLAINAAIPLQPQAGHVEHIWQHALFLLIWVDEACKHMGDLAQPHGPPSSRKTCHGMVRALRSGAVLQLTGGFQSKAACNPQQSQNAGSTMCGGLELPAASSSPTPPNFPSLCTTHQSCVKLLSRIPFLPCCLAFLVV